jgi:hypothetical protein
VTTRRVRERAECSFGVFEIGEAARCHQGHRIEGPDN